MDEFGVSFHTPETKNESKHWLPKGQPGPLKERTQASRKKQMVFSFFDAAGIIYQHYAPLGAKLNAVYLTNVMGKFLRTFRSKRPLQAKKKVDPFLGQLGAPHRQGHLGLLGASRHRNDAARSV